MIYTSTTCNLTPIKRKKTHIVSAKVLMATAYKHTKSEPVSMHHHQLGNVSMITKLGDSKISHRNLII